MEDPLISEALKKYNMMDSGFSIDTNELPAIEVELINMLKSKMNKKEIDNKMKAQTRGGMM